MQPFDYQKSVVEVDNLLRKFRMSEKEVKLVLAAFDFAYRKHEEKGEKRESGEPYIVHPYGVAKILMEETPVLDAAMFAAAFLHDTVEDCGVTIEEIRFLFGPVVAFYVDALSDIDKLEFDSRMEADQYNFRRLNEKILEKIAVYPIKGSDRLFNLRTLAAKKGEYKRVHTAYETMEVHVPLTHFLGMRTFEKEMEEIAFHFLYEPYEKDINEALKQYLVCHQPNIELVLRILNNLFRSKGINCQISFNTKGIPSIASNIYKQHQNIERIHDLKQIVIVADNLDMCNHIISLIKKYFYCLPHKEKNYLVTPKPNLYQAFLTTIVGPNNDLFQVRIMTGKMVYTNNYGIMAFKTSEKMQTVFKNNFGFFNQALESGLFTLGNKEQTFILPNAVNEKAIEVTVEGEKVFLPLQSTVYDLIYSYYKDDYANHITGVIINGEQVSTDFCANHQKSGVYDGTESGCDYILKNNDEITLIYSYDELSRSNEELKEVLGRCMTKQAKKSIENILTKTK